MGAWIAREWAHCLATQLDGLDRTRPGRDGQLLFILSNRRDLALDVAQALDALAEGDPRQLLTNSRSVTALRTQLLDVLDQLQPTTQLRDVVA